MDVTSVICTKLDGPSALAIGKRPRPVLKSDDVRVAVRAAGLNFPDLLMTRGLYQYRPELPFVPGMEAAGVVLEVGADVRGAAVGDRVMALTRTGAFAEELVTPAASVFPLPSGVSFDEGACLMIAGQTAHHALVGRGALKEKETLLVFGATGGVGLAAVQMARILGATVIAVGSSASKLAAARDAGATHTVGTDGSDLVERVRALTGGRGVDVIYDPVGGKMAREGVRLLEWGGRYLVVGFASGEIPRFAGNHALLKGYSVIGVRAGEAARRDPAVLARAVRDIRTWAEAGQLRPHISHRVPLERAADALLALESRQVVGRAVLTMEVEESAS